MRHHFHLPHRQTMGILLFTLLLLVIGTVISYLSYSEASEIKASVPTKEVGPGYAFTSIQSAIDDAEYGERILVHDGTYYENINFKGKEITLCSENGADFTTIWGNEMDSVVSFDHFEGKDSVLDGFTITNGGYGAVYCDSSSPSIVNCTIKNNNWNGVYCEGGSPEISNCKILNNIENGINNCYGSSPIITQCTIEGNGGGIYCEGGSPAITDCIIRSNLNAYDGGGIYCADCSPIIHNSIISDNTASSEGGGICFHGSSSAIITHCIIDNNYAYDWGGGILLCTSSSISTTNCIISNNRASTLGGGGILIFYSSLVMTNCTIVNNYNDPGSYYTSEGGGIYNYDSSLKMTNCIVWENKPDEISGSESMVTYCNVQGGYGNLESHNINDDPLFIDLNIGDYHLQPNSPCIDAGDPNATGLPLTDKDNNPRTINGKPDIGAFEHVNEMEILWFYPGFNFVNFPQNLEENYPTALSLWNFFSEHDINIKKIQTYQPELGIWLTWRYGDDENFPIFSDKGWFMYIDQNQTAPRLIYLSSSSSSNFLNSDLFTGLNLVSYTYLNKTLNLAPATEGQWPKDLFDSIEQATGKQSTSINAYQSQTGKWRAKYPFFGYTAGPESMSLSSIKKNGYAVYMTTLE